MLCYKLLYFFFSLNTSIKIRGTSLVVQWLTLCTPNAGAQAQFPVRELDPTCHNWEFACCSYNILQAAAEKILHAATKIEDLASATKTWHSQVNKQRFKERSMQPGMYIWLVSAHHVEGRHSLLIHPPWDGPLSYLQLPTTLDFAFTSTLYISSFHPI